MLVIRRRVGESILVADSIELIVLEISGTRVKLGVRADASIPVLRAEAAEAARQNLAAAGSQIDHSLDEWARLLRREEISPSPSFFLKSPPPSGR